MVLLEFDPNKPRKISRNIKNRKCKTMKNTHNLGGGENPSINVILDYKTPPLKMKEYYYLLEY